MSNKIKNLEIVREVELLFNEEASEEEPEYLEEAVVNAQKSHLGIKEDTTTYAADELRNSPVTTIEDLIGDIPDVSIDEQSGTIRYQNTEISTILIDGDNLTDRNYQFAEASFNTT